MMDIEEAEGIVIPAATRFLDEIRPTWLIELHGEGGAAADQTLVDHVTPCDNHSQATRSIWRRYDPTPCSRPSKVRPRKCYDPMLPQPCIGTLGSLSRGRLASARLGGASRLNGVALRCPSPFGTAACLLLLSCWPSAVLADSMATGCALGVASRILQATWTTLRSHHIADHP